MIKINIYIVSIIILVLISNNTTAQDKLIGTWERFDDRFEGARIEIMQTGETLKAFLIYVPEFMKEYCFEKGDVKWINMKKYKEDYYELEDLRKKCETSPLYEPSYHLMYLNVISDNEIHITTFYKEDIRKVPNGQFQKWRRIQ